MSLQPFRVPGGTFSSSITMDASTVGDTTVTVAVSATRDQEPAILNSIYDHSAAQGLDFKPFYHKANNFKYQEKRRFVEAVIEDNWEYLAAFVHSREHDGNADTQQVEAVHSAIHVDDLLTDEPESLVIVDGNEQQATPFVRGLRALRSDVPTVGHCLQSEYYYPTALLADLASNYLAHRIDRGAFDPTESLLPVPHAKQARKEWGQVFHAMYQGSSDYTPPEIRNLRGETVRERIYCWYTGAVALDSGAERPMSDSLNPVVQALQRDGYEELAATLAEL